MVLLLTLHCAGSGPALAQGFSVFPPTVVQGGTLTFAGDGCFYNPLPPSADLGPDVTLTGLTGLQITVRSDTATGTFSGTVEIPVSAPPGVYQLTARCERSPLSSAGPSFVYPAQAVNVLDSTTASSQPPTQATTTTMPPSPCHPSYAPCLPRNAVDVDCLRGGGDGPEYIEPMNFPVLGPDVYELDSDGNGLACEDKDVPPTGGGRPGGVRPVEDLDTSTVTTAPPSTPSTPSTRLTATSAGTRLGRTGTATVRYLMLAALLVCFGSMLIVAAYARRRALRKMA